MKPETIQYRLKRLGIKQYEIAAAIGASEVMIHKAIHGNTPNEALIKTVLAVAQGQVSLEEAANFYASSISTQEPVNVLE